MTNLMQKALLLFVFIVWTGVVRADITPETLEQGKRATALVEIGNGRGFGTAFCIDVGGFFITNSHVVAGANDNEITLVLRPGEKDQRSLKAKIVRTDTALDLALLWAEKP